MNIVNFAADDGVFEFSFEFIAGVKSPLRLNPVLPSCSFWLFVMLSLEWKITVLMAFFPDLICR